MPSSIEYSMRMGIRAAKTWRLGLALAVTAMAAAWTAAPSAHALDGAMRVDCNAAIAGIQDGCTYVEPGETFKARINVTDPPAGGHYGFQTKLAWSAANLQYLPTEKSQDEALWPNCTIPARSDNQPGESSVLFACIPFPTPPGGYKTTGAVLEHKLRCLQDGTLALRLVPRAGDGQLGTHFLNQSSSPVDPALTDAKVQCGKSVVGPDGTKENIPPNLTLRAPARQRILRRRGVVVIARADEDSTVSANGTITVRGSRRASRVAKTLKLRGAKLQLKANKDTKIKLKASRRVLAQVRRALKKRRLLTATISATPTDLAANSGKRRSVGIRLVR